MENDYFDEDALLCPVVRNDLPERELLVSATDLQEAMYQKVREDRHVPQSIVKKKRNDTAVLEVESGTADAAIIDSLMADAMVGEGTSYDQLTYTIELNSEEYGVGFRKGSDLVDAFNEFWAQAVADGTVLEVATTYGLQDAVILE